MKSIKVWIFTGCILAVFILNYLFHWSSRICDMNNLVFLKQAVQDNILMAAILLPAATLLPWIFTERWAWPGLLPKVFSKRGFVCGDRHYDGESHGIIPISR